MQEDGGGARVWVPSIALGWDRGGFHPPRLNAARLGKVAQAEANEGDEILILKWVPNFSDDDDDELMVIQVRPSEVPPEPKARLEVF